MTAGMGEQSVEVAGRQVAIRRSGDGETALVLVSSAGGGHEQWEQTRSRLDDTISCVTYCRPGIGTSDDLPADSERRTTVAEAAHHLRHVLDAAQLPPPYVLAGSSIGGWIVDRFTMLWPDLVTGLVLVDPTMLTPMAGLREDSDVVDDSAADDRTGFVFGWGESLTELQAHRPNSPVPRSIVVSRAPASTTDDIVAAYWKPLTATQFRSAWADRQQEWAERLAAVHVVAGTAGHHVQRDQPDLVAHLLQAAATAAHEDRDLRPGYGPLTETTLNDAGGKLLDGWSGPSRCRLRGRRAPGRGPRSGRPLAGWRQRLGRGNSSARRR